MLSPKKTKYRKQHKGRMRGRAHRGADFAFGDFALQATECGRITARQIEAARVAMTRYTKRGGRVWIRIFPDKPITKKPAEVRMGKGKGSVEEWVAVIKPDRIIYEMADLNKAEAIAALRLASHKLPIKCKTIVRPGAKEFVAKRALPPEPKPAPAAAPAAAPAEGGASA